MIVKLAGIAAGSFFVAFSGALMPGPVLAVTIEGTRRRGFLFGPLVVLGHAIVELPIVVLLVLGLGAVLDNRWAVVIIGYAGAAAMAWMGVSMLRQARRPSDEEPGSVTMRLGPVGSGALTSVLNPYWYLWWVSMGAVLLAGAAWAGWLGVAVFFAGHISADLAWYSLVSFGVAKGKRYLTGRPYQALMIVCALILLAMAGRFLYLAACQTLAPDGPPAPEAASSRRADPAVPALSPGPEAFGAPGAPRARAAEGASTRARLPRSCQTALGFSPNRIYNGTIVCR